MSVETLSRPVLEMPLAKVPEPKLRTGLSSELLNTAGHELNHCLAAIACGVPVVSLSVARDGQSLGRTIFAGTLSPSKIQVIASAGCVATHDGCAHGYGNDMFKVDFLTHFDGGMTRESAISHATEFISRYSTHVRRNAAEIIAYLGTVSGEEMPLVLLRAQMEINIENGIIDSQFVSNANPTETKRPKEEPKNYTIIDHLTNGDYRITYIIVGEKKREEILCGKCKIVNGHSKDCPNHNILEDITKSDTIVNGSEVSNSRNKLSAEGIIFSAN